MSSIFGGFVEVVSVRYRCRLCRTDFDSHEALLSHCRYTSRHAWDERCQLIFATNRDMDEHLMSSLEHYMCFECETRPDFDGEEELEHHLETAHFWCRACDDFSIDSRAGQGHVCNARPACTVCSRAFVNHEALNQHVRASHGVARNGCPRISNDETALRQHMDASHGAASHGTRSRETNLLECPRCLRPGFTRFFQLLEHLERTACSIPWRLKTLAFRYRDHPAYGTDITDPEPFRCENCRRRFANLSSLYSHVEHTMRCEHLLQPGQQLNGLKRYIIANYPLPSR